MRVLARCVSAIGVAVTVMSGCGQRTRDAASPVASSATGACRTSAVSSPRDVAPAFRVVSADGRVFDSASLVGKPVVLVFFTSWCPVCDRELPKVQAALQAAGDDVVALGVSLDDGDTWSDVDGVVKRMAPRLAIVRGETNAAIVEAYDANRSFPVVVVIDDRGRISFVQRGAHAQDDLSTAIQRSRECKA